MTVPMPAMSGPSLALRHPAFRLGLFVGAALASVALAWLVVANRVPSLERFPIARNSAGAILFGALILIPICWFAKSPASIFLSGALASLIVALAYRIAAEVFPRLGERIGAFHVFVLGAVIFGLFATLDRVVQLLWAVRPGPAATARRRLP